MREQGREKDGAMVVVHKRQGNDRQGRWKTREPFLRVMVGGLKGLHGIEKEMRKRLRAMRRVKKGERK